MGGRLERMKSSDMSHLSKRTPPDLILDCELGNKRDGYSRIGGQMGRAGWTGSRNSTIGSSQPVLFMG